MATRIRKSEVEAAVALLKTAKEGAFFEGATFSQPGVPPWAPETAAYTKEICEATALYRGTWLVTPIGDALRLLEAELARDGAPTGSGEGAAS